MINLEEGTLNGDPIIDWEIRWMTPFGLTPDLDEAVRVVKSYELEPNLYVWPVSIAISESEREAYMR